jgi:3-hydroxyisobutyrate dehydrogenase
MRIGIAGIGRMGAAIAERLLAQGHEVRVWNRTADKTRSVAAGGAKIVASPAALSGDCEVVISILTDAAAIDSVYLSRQGLLTGDVAAKLFIDMSTVRPDAAIALAKKVRAKGAVFVECPVGGTVGPAQEGKLFGFVGGDDGDVARARPVLDQLCRRVEHIGPVGAGSRMKLAINLPLMVYWEVLGEALALCAPLKLDPARIMDIFMDTSGGANVLKVRGPMIAKAMNGKEIKSVTFDVDLIRKDLRAMVEEGAAKGFAFPVAQRALECYDDASREGMGAADVTMLLVRWVRRAQEKQ